MQYIHVRDTRLHNWWTKWKEVHLLHSHESIEREVDYGKLGATQKSIPRLGGSSLPIR